MARLKPELPSRPQQWWQTLATGSAELPFRAYFDELLPPTHRGDVAEMPSAVDLELLLRARVTEPVHCRPRSQVHRVSWGEDGGLIEEWFDEGDKGGCAPDVLIEEPEPDRLDRALDWIRSLAVATKLIPA